MNNITILTYNILSSSLATLMESENKNEIQIYPHDIMDDNCRWIKISNQISNIINRNLPNLIICLQEVSEDWLHKFSFLFEQLNYKFINAQYGKILNGNMGVLIAYPSYLNIIKYDILNVGSKILIEDEMSQKAALKSNKAILAMFENMTDKFRFGVITYHMPCEPLIPKISLIHSKVLYKKVKKFMENTEWILIGDFNMLPNTLSYKYFSENLKCVWKNFLHYYPITNHSYIKNIEFAGCIDYAFYTKNLECTNIMYSDVKNIIPDINEPSDHISILISFNLP